MKENNDIPKDDSFIEEDSLKKDEMYYLFNGLLIASIITMFILVIGFGYIMLTLMGVI